MAVAQRGITEKMMTVVMINMVMIMMTESLVTSTGAKRMRFAIHLSCVMGKLAITSFYSYYTKSRIGRAPPIFLLHVTPTLKLDSAAFQDYILWSVQYQKRDFSMTTTKILREEQVDIKTSQRPVLA